MNPFTCLLGIAGPFGQSRGNAAAGRVVYAKSGCGGCHMIVTGWAGKEPVWGSGPFLRRKPPSSPNPYADRLNLLKQLRTSSAGIDCSRMLESHWTQFAILLDVWKIAELRKAAWTQKLIPLAGITHYETSLVRTRMLQAVLWSWELWSQEVRE